MVSELDEASANRIVSAHKLLGIEGDAKFGRANRQPCRRATQQERGAVDGRVDVNVTKCAPRLAPIAEDFGGAH